MDAVPTDKQTEENNASDCGSEAQSLLVDGTASPEPDVDVAIEALATPTYENHEPNHYPVPQSKKVRKKLAMAMRFE